MNQKLPFKQLVILHAALMMGPLSFVAIVFFIHSDPFIFGFDLSNPLPIVAIAFSSSALFLSRFLFTKMISSFDTQASASDRFEVYRRASIVSWALVEGSALFNCIVAMLTGSSLFLIISVFLIAYLFYLKPSKSKAVEILGTDESDFE